MKRIFLTLFVAAPFFTCMGQKRSEIEKANIKSVVVTEQKFEGSASKTYKESETYYDNKGNVIEEILYKDGKFDSHTKYQYDAKNNKIKETEISSDGKKVLKVIEFKYNGDFKTEKTVYDANGNVKSKKTYKYENY
jgi:hypothetical protein